MKRCGLHKIFNMKVYAYFEENRTVIKFGATYMMNYLYNTLDIGKCFLVEILSIFLVPALIRRLLVHTLHHVNKVYLLLLLLW